MMHLRENFWAVEVPEGATGFTIEDHKVRNVINERDMKRIEWSEDRPTRPFVIIPPGTWQIIGISKDLTEEQARGIVEYDAFYDGYKDYDTENFHNDLPFISPLDSLHSLLTSKGLDPENSLIIQKM